MIYTYHHNGQTYTVALEPQPDGSYTALIGERSYRFQAQALPEGGWRLHFVSPENESHIVYTAARGDSRFASIGGQDYAFTVPNQRAQRRRTASSGDLSAQMPGQVVNVLVAEGETVQRGQTLVILEAMKMEIRVAAPAEGRVKRLLVQKGQIVERGQLLLEIAPL